MTFIVALHLLAAMAWIGGMLFLSLIVVPIFKREGFNQERTWLFKSVALRFRVVVWISILSILFTGAFLLSAHVDSSTGSQSWPMILQLKLFLVTFLIGITAAHDFWIGPLVARRKAGSGSLRPAEKVLLTVSPWIARLSLLIALVILFLGILVARS